MAHLNRRAGSVGESDEVAGAAVFLASDAAVNGSALRVEGGIIRSI